MARIAKACDQPSGVVEREFYEQHLPRAHYRLTRKGADQRTVRYLGLFPNLLLSLHPDYVLTHRLVPMAPDRTFIECEWLFADAVTDPSYAVEFWDITNRQDWVICESVQRGMASRVFRQGFYAPMESMSLDIRRYIRERLD